MRKIVILSDKIESNHGFIELLRWLFPRCEISTVSRKVEEVNECSIDYPTVFHHGDAKLSETDE